MKPEELQYYSRQTILSDFGIESQEKLKSSYILMIGAGGLGCPVLQSLAAIGVGNIGIVDFDKISASNLHRQTIYKYEDIGQWKCDKAKQFIQALNPFIEVETFRVIANEETLPALEENYDIVVDCTDNPLSKYLINDICVITGKTLVYGSVFKMEGNVSVFNLNNDSPTLRCLFPENPDEMPDCNRTGILGIITASTGLYMAAEVVKIILSKKDILSGKLLIIKPFEASTQILNFEATDDGRQKSKNRFQTSISDLIISPTALKKLMDSNEDFDLIDVRSDEEREICHIGGKLVPLDELEDRLYEIDSNKKTIIYCHHGIRSQNAVDFLRSVGYTNVINLEGGIHLWSIEVDDSVRIY